MKFAYKFVIFLFFALAFVIVANIGALGYFSKEYFDEYLEETKSSQKTQTVDVSLLGSVIEGKWLDQAAIEEYRTTLKDLGSISDSLERFSQNPGAFVEIPAKQTSSGSQVSGPASVKELLSRILALKEYPSESPEWHFVAKMTKAIGFVNLIVISLVLAVSWWWISFAFRPIRAVVDRIQGIAVRKDYATIRYERKDEFYPLVAAINGLSHNLSLQEKIRQDLLSDLSHEIRTPIAAIRCYLEGMQDGVIPMGESTLALLFAEIERLVKITNSIIEIERTEWKHWSDLRVERVDLTEIMSSIKEEYAPLLSQDNQHIEFRTDRHFYAVADRDMFVQICHNLVSNFHKYSGKNTTLSIRFFHTADMFGMVFEDNGKGVPEKELPFLQEKFYQVDKTRTITDDRGSGIGLSIVEKIVRLHAGTLEIESAEGSFFRVKIRIPKSASI